jgi:hypothetical protein
MTTDAKSTRVSHREPYRGQGAYLYASDAAYEMSNRAPDDLLRQPPRPYTMLPDKRKPRHAFF